MTRHSLPSLLSSHSLAFFLCPPQSTQKGAGLSPMDIMAYQAAIRPSPSPCIQLGDAIQHGDVSDFKCV